MTFFRSMGGAFGVSVFGAIFSNRLTAELTSALHGLHVPPGFKIADAESNPKLIKQLPPALRDPIRHAFSLALHPVFLTAVPVALVAFVLSWFLREVPLRGAAGAADLGEAIPAAPTDRSSVEEVERALARLSAADIRRDGYTKLGRAAGLNLPGGACWVLTRLARQDTMPGTGSASQAGVTVEAAGRSSTSWCPRASSPGPTGRCPSPRRAARRPASCSPHGTNGSPSCSRTGRRSSTPSWPSC